MTRIASIVSALLLAGSTSAVAAGTSPPSLYERLADKLAHDPALAQQLRKPAPEMAQVAWMVGEWDITARVFATRKESERVSHGTSKVTPQLGGVWLQVVDSYDQAIADLSFLTYSPTRKRWITLTIDGSTNATQTMADRWTGNRLVFTGAVDIVGESTTLRQTVEKRGDREYHVLNEEHLPDGTWVKLDEYLYKKR